MIDRAFWFVQRNFIALLAVVAVAIVLAALVRPEYAQIVPAVYFSFLGTLVVLRSGTGMAARIGFGAGVIGMMLLLLIVVL